MHIRWNKARWWGMLMVLAMGACGGGGSGAGASAGSGSAATLAAKLGKPSRLLVGLGTGGSETALIQAQGLRPDFYERYLTGRSNNGGWTTWNSPAGAYASYVMSQADSVGAVPMFTLFQFSEDTPVDLTNLADSTFMQTYWSDVMLLLQAIHQYGKPVLINIEPDFWGFAEQVTNASYGGNPASVPAVLSADSACTGLPSRLTGFAPCMINLARKYAPTAAMGLSPSGWGGGSAAAVVTFMNQVGAARGDFIVMQTVDRDAGCLEQAIQADCTRSGTGWYWDASNQSHPNFQDHFAEALAYHTGIGGLPLVWWQTPFGAPSATAGGTADHYRDNRVDYFLKHPGELVAVGGLGVVFGAGAEHQTTPASDGGQFQTLSLRYLANPVALP